jgi:hypothetical protein
MFLNENRDLDGSACLLEFDDLNGWLRATWTGYIDQAEAVQGAESYLHATSAHPCAYLLNDNTRLRGPWFDSIDWLERVWVPQALRLGLRYVAHVPQQDDPTSYATTQVRNPSDGQFELQIFAQVADAERWLRSCQQSAG